MKSKNVVIALLIIGSFLFIHAGYNHPYDTFLEGLLWIIKENGITFKYDDFPFQFILVTIYFLSGLFFKKSILFLSGIFLFILLLLFWIYILSNSIVFSYLSMMPFFIISILSIIQLLKSRKNE